MTGESPLNDRRQHLILCGLGHVGERVFALLAALGEPIVAISVLLFMGRHPAGGHASAPDDRRMILCGRRPGALRFEPLASGQPLTEMEEWIGIRWYRLHQPNDTPC